MRRRLRRRTHAPRVRRGVALVLTLLLTFAMGALAMGAIYLTSNGQLLGMTAEREKELRYAADAALQIARAPAQRHERRAELLAPVADRPHRLRSAELLGEVGTREPNELGAVRCVHHDAPSYSANAP